METLIEEVIDNTIFKKKSFINRLFEKIKLKCRSSCICSIDTENDIVETKKKQKEEFINLIKILKRNSLKLECEIQEQEEEEEQPKKLLETEI